MKTKVRNYSVCALAAAVLLAAVMLVTGCPAEPSTDAGYKPSPGMGAIQLKFGPIARATTLPEDADENWFALFGLEFQPWSGGTTIPGQSVSVKYYTLTDLAAPIDLVPGDYILEVIGYASEDNGVGEGPAATATLNFTIVLGTPLPQTITLKAYDPIASTEEGMFAWKINSTLTDPIASIFMNVTNIAGTVTAITNRNITTELTNDVGVALAAGYYYVVFSLTTEGGIVREFRHVLHIYQNMTSTFTYTFTDEKLGVIESVETEEFTLTIEVDPFEDFAPTWTVSAGTGAGTEVSPLIISLTGETAPITGAITVTNYNDYDGEDEGHAYTAVQWYCNGANLATSAIGGVLTIINTVAPFTAAGTYQLKITGLVGVVPYEAEDVFIQVIEDPEEP
jgi:hypothetical protein